MQATMTSQQSQECYAAIRRLSQEAKGRTIRVGEVKARDPEAARAAQKAWEVRMIEMATGRE